MRRIFPLVLIVLATGVLSLHASADADNSAVLELTQRFFDAYAAKDVDAFMALWSEKSPDFEARKKTTAGLYAETGPIELKSLTVVRARRNDNAAAVRVRVELAANDRNTGKPHPSFGALDRVLELAYEDQRWQVVRYVPSGIRLMERLAETKSKAVRLHLLDGDANLIGPDFVAMVLSEGYAQGERGRFDQASRLQDVAFEVAGGLGDRDAQACCHLNRGMLLQSRLGYESALASYQMALALFHEANDPKGEAITLNNLGNVYEARNHYAEALQQYQDSLKISRGLNDRQMEATALNSIGIVYRNTARYAEALQHHQDSLKIERELKGHAGEAISLSYIGNVYVHTEHYAEGLQQYQDSLKIFRDLKDRAGEASVLSNIGMIYKATGRYAEALQQYQDSLKIERELKDRVGEAKTLNNVGNVYEAAGRYAEALQQYQDSLTVSRELKDRVGEAKALNNVGSVYEATGRYAEALQQFQDSLPISRELKRRASEARALGDIGNVYEYTGRYAEALQQYQDSLTISRELKDRVGEAKTLNNVGTVYEATGRYAEALQQYQDSLTISRELKSRAVEEKTLCNVGNVYEYTGRYAEALQQYQDSLTISRELKDRAGETKTLNNVGAVYEAAGRYAEALQQYQDSLTISRELKDRAGEAKTLGNIGTVYEATGRYAEAFQQYQDSLTISRELKSHAVEAITLCNIGNVYESTGRHAEALQQYQECLKIADRIRALDVAVSCHGNLGRAYQALKHWNDAVRSYSEAVRLTELLRTNAREPSLQSSLLAQKIDPFFLLAVCRLELHKPDEAFATGERMKARGLVDILQQGKTDLRRGMSAQEQEQEQRLQNQVTALGVQLENLRSRKADAAGAAALVGDLDKARQDYDAFRLELYLHRPELETRRAEFAPAGLDALGHSLFAGRPGLVVLSYLVGEKETLLFVLTAPEKEGGTARLTVHRLDVGSKELAEAVDAFRTACAEPAAAVPDADELYRWLIAPAADELAGAKQVVISPDGVLHTLPFQALRDPDGKYLIERFPVSYAPSVTALTKMEGLGAARRKEYAGKPASLLAVGVSDFGRRERLLPAAEKEARAVAASFGDNAKLLPGAEATLAKLEASWSGRRYLHFATHGRLNPDAPLYSSLVLSPGVGDEGVLYARDLLDVDVPAELAVMSACHTGEGRHMAGEGLQGMSWAWFVAGVPSTVASQWSVGDASTAQLMKAFYGRLKAGDSKAEALRQAELTLLKDAATRHPFYWAPFVLVGDDK